MTSLGLLLIRLVTGGFLVGHGAQKLFGAFGGRGIEGTARYFEGLGIRPGDKWALVAGAGEITGGGLTALGLLFPLGPIVATAPMIVAWRKGHGDKPIWVNQGGAELPATNIAVACALLLAGPGALSLDRLVGIRVPWWVSLLAMAATAGGVLLVLEDDISELAAQVRAQEREAEVAEPEELPAAT